MALLRTSKARVPLFTKVTQVWSGRFNSVLITKALLEFPLDKIQWGFTKIGWPWQLGKKPETKFITFHWTFQTEIPHSRPF